MRLQWKHPKAFTLMEIMVAVSFFVIAVTTRFIIDTNSINTYLEFVNVSKLEQTTNDLYGYLYTYKKTHWTNDFINLISQGDPDNNCNGNDFNWNWDINDEIDEYCFFYPYYCFKGRSNKFW